MRRMNVHGLGLASALVVVLAALAALAAPASDAQESIAEKRARLESQLELIERQIDAQEGVLSEKQAERTSLERDIGILDAEIEKARLNIQARDIAIEDLSFEITQRQEKLEQLNERLRREKESLAQIIRKTDELDDYTTVEIILSNQSLAEFFEELDDFEAVKMALSDSFKEIERVQNNVSAEKLALEEERGEEVSLKTVQELEKQKVEEREVEKQRLLEVTKGEEERYQELLQESQQTASEIRAQLFALRDTADIKFEDALELARFAGAQTGVRPALILAILTQETRLGQFLGTGNWQEDMHPSRDRPLYLAITQHLGLDPDAMPVSKQPGYGWGGAMGPAQFIPSTWACYGGWRNTRTGDCNNSQRSLAMEDFWSGPWQYDQSLDRIRQLTGKDSPSNPWDNRDAFMGTAVLMMDNGAAAGTHAAERLAALRYFAGWANADNPSYAFYGDEVMAHARNYQRQIEILDAAE